MTDDVPVRRQPAEPMDPFWQPNRYPEPDVSKDGAWRQILNGTTPIGLIWTDFADGVGITWVTQTPETVHLFTLLQRMKTINAPASSAYVAATQAEEGFGSLGPQQTGPLSRAQAEVNQLHGGH